MNRLRLRVETTNEERSEAARDRENWRKDLDGLLEGERVQRVKDVLEGRIKEMERQLGELQICWSLVRKRPQNPSPPLPLAGADGYYYS